MKKILAFAVASLFAATAFAQQYKWVDKDGKTRYGDTPPPGVKATPLKGPPAASAPPSAPPAKDGKATASSKPLTPAEQEADFRKRQQEAEKDREKQEKLASEQAAKREGCARAQEQLRTIQSGQRIARTDSKGERYFLDEKQTAQEAERTQKLVREMCG